MTEKLKKCPFCGGEAELIEHTDGSGGIYCKNGKCKFTPLTHHFGRYCSESKQDVIDWWNTRAEDENPVLTLDELREMEGEPVYVTYFDGSGGEWGIVTAYGTDKIGAVVTPYNTFWFDDICKPIAYRRKPEGEEVKE